MGSFIGVDQTAFWAPFASLYTQDKALNTRSVERLSEFWRDAARYYADGKRGRLVLQTSPDMPLRGRRHINYPLWQVPPAPRAPNTTPTVPLPILNYHATVADICLLLARAKFFDPLRAVQTRHPLPR